MKTKKNDGLNCVDAYSRQNASRPTRVFNTAGLALAGTALLGIVLFGESASPARLLCIGLILAGIAGLKLLSDA